MTLAPDELVGEVLARLKDRRLPDQVLVERVLEVANKDGIVYGLE